MDGDLPEKVSCYQGVFYNYFSIGMHSNVNLFLFLYAYIVLVEKVRLFCV